MRVKNGTSMLQRKAGEVKRYRQEKRIIPIVMVCLALLAAIVYVVSLLYTRFGSFTVKVDKFDQLDYGLSLSETRDFRNPTSRLDCKASKVITNIDGKKEIPEDVGSEDGAANGENYMCYSFYCTNAGKKTVDFEYSIQIVTMTLDIEKAVRIRQISSLNGGDKEVVDYARAKGVDENNNPIPEEGTVPFYEKTTVKLDKQLDFNVGDTIRYTIVIWLEGNDPECVDSIIGGEFKIDMKFQVLSGK